MAQRVSCSCDCSVILGILDLITGIFVFLSGLLTLLGSFDILALRIFLLGAFFMYVSAHTHSRKCKLATHTTCNIQYYWNLHHFVGAGLDVSTVLAITTPLVAATGHILSLCSPFLDIWFPFYTRSFMGKGAFFLLYVRLFLSRCPTSCTMCSCCSLGCLLFVPPRGEGRNTVFFVFSLLVLITAVIYMVLHCLAGIPAPFPLLQACGIQCHCDCCGGTATATSHSTVNPGTMSTYKSSTVTRTVHRV